MGSCSGGCMLNSNNYMQTVGNYIGLILMAHLLYSDIFQFFCYSYIISSRLKYIYSK